MHKRIASFISKKYLFTLCCSYNNQPWANTFYYVFDEPNDRLIYITSAETHHSRVMLENPAVSGTIFTPTRFVASLQGVQFTGIARMLEGEESDIAKSLYREEYHHDLIDQLPVWEVSLEYARLIDRSLGMFGTVEWRLGEPEIDEFTGLSLVNDDNLRVSD